MSFLDNSGDIILDAVLTDTGRRQLARGDGSFRIVKFAFGDDEVNYELYATGAAGANRDLDILQSPVFEAFTNNTSTMKSKLLTIANNNLLYLPVNKLNQNLGPQLMATTGNSHAADTNGAILLSVDRTTSDAFEAGINTKLNGLLLADGTNYSDNSLNSALTFDQGLDNVATGVSPLGEGSELRESQYIVEVDNRLLNLAAVGAQGNNGRAVLSPSFIDDDNIASYFISYQGGNLGESQFFDSITTGEGGVKRNSTAVNGRPGYRFRFALKAAQDAETTDYLFTTFGSTITSTSALGASGLTTGLRFIDTTVRITGFTTGYRVDIPVRLLKAF
jgi:hypothetical protein